MDKETNDLLGEIRCKMSSSTNNEPSTIKDFSSTLATWISKHGEKAMFRHLFKDYPFKMKKQLKAQDLAEIRRGSTKKNPIQDKIREIQKALERALPKYEKYFEAEDGDLKVGQPSATWVKQGYKWVKISVLNPKADERYHFTIQMWKDGKILAIFPEVLKLHSDQALRSGNKQVTKYSYEDLDVSILANPAKLFKSRQFEVRKQLKARSLAESGLRNIKKTHYDSLVQDPNLMPKVLAKTYLTAFKQLGKGKKFKVEVIKSETTMPRGWDHGNYTVLKVTVPSGKEVNVAITLNVKYGEESSGIVMADAEHGSGVIAMCRYDTAQRVVNNLMIDAVPSLAKR
jgi:hypothetical protein